MVYIELPLNIKRYGSLDRKRNDPSDKCSCKDNHKMKRSVKNCWLIRQKLWSILTLWFALYLIQREIIWKLYNFKRLPFDNMGQYLNERILNAVISEPQLETTWYALTKITKKLLQQFSLFFDKLRLLFQWDLNSQIIQCICGWMSGIFVGINKFDLQSSIATKIKSEVVGDFYGVQYI